MLRLDALFEPKSVAVVGASATPGKVGHSVVSNLIESRYQGKIYPVNPKGGEILSLSASSSLKDLPEVPDLVVISVPPPSVKAVLAEAADIGVKAVAVITAGFKEVGREGFYLEQELVEIAQRERIALLGPNCLGLMNTGIGLNATFAAGTPDAGNIAFFSQSGALCIAILDWALGENIGFSKFVSLGNKAVLDEAHVLEYLADDPATKVILGYMESVEDGREFLRVAKQVTRKKPVIIIKSGTTSAGARAASSHTGAIAGSDQAYGAAFSQAGVIRVHDVETLFTLAQAFAMQPLPAGPNLAIVTNSGGPGILAADAAERSRLNMSSLTQATIKKLGEFLPPYASLYNPVDIIGDADAERYRKTLATVAEDEMVHAVMALLTPTNMVQIEETAQAIIDTSKGTSKPVFACFMGKDRVEPGRKMLIEAEVPCYGFPEPALAGIEALYRHKEWQDKSDGVEVCYLRDLGKARQVLSKAKDSGCSELVEFQAQDILAAYELPRPETVLAKTSAKAAAAAKKIGYPVVLKIASPDISHKSDVGGVRPNIKTEEELVRAFTDIMSRARELRPEAYLAGCLVQAMAPKGCKEVIVGFKRDEQFGPLVMFGLGGVYVEILKDISFRLAPLSLDDAHEMIREIKIFPLLRGVRGEKPVNFRAIEDVLLVMSQLAMDFPDIYEAEFNPVMVNDKGALVADVRLSLCANG
jgi:acetyltransferase